jgi:hypothetical protein
VGEGTIGELENVFTHQIVSFPVFRTAFVSTYHLFATSVDQVGVGTTGELEKVFIPVIVSATLQVFFTTQSTNEFQTVAVKLSPVSAFSTHSHHHSAQYTTVLTIQTDKIDKLIFLNIFNFILD